MTATVFYDSASEIALIAITFLNSAGVLADPTTIACVITDPSGSASTHTYAGAAPADMVKLSTGKYTLSVPCLPTVTGVDGLWSYVSIGTGAVSDVQPGTWRVLPTNIGAWYIGLEEFKDRLGITDPADDSQAQIAIQSVCQWINEYCVVMDTPILTADLRWVPAGDLVLGQEIIGVDEEPAILRPGSNGAAQWLRGTNHGRCYRRAEVRAIPHRMAECIRIILSDGREVTCATDHRWLARPCWPSGAPKSGYRWTHTRDITPGDEICAPLRPWPEETGFEAGWMSGLFDGEGWFASSKPTHTRIGVAQNQGVVLDRILKYLDNADIPHYETGTPAHDICTRVEIGSRWAVMELLGRLRPCRMMSRANAVWENRSMVGSGRSNVRVLTVEPVGLREVVSIGTSTGTYIANGLVSHNCGRHFNRITEIRTFQPQNIWMLEIDDLVSVTALAFDMEGDGTYELSLTQNVDYQLRLGTGLYNINATGIARPYKQVQIIQTGKWFPFTWPYTTLNRVQIAGTWGWPSVPPPVTQAAFILAADIFKMKDAPFGVSGVSDFGVVKISANPWLVEMLRPYVNSKRKVGV